MIGYCLNKLYTVLPQNVKAAFSMAAFSMKNLNILGISFINFNSTTYGTEVRFQQGMRPTEGRDGGEPYSGSEHQLYRFKTEVSVLDNDLCIQSSPNEVGSVSDSEILHGGIGGRRNML